MLSESSSDQKKTFNSNDLAVKESGVRNQEDFFGCIRGYDGGDIFSRDPLLTLFEDSQKEDLLSQLDYCEEKLTLMKYKQQQSKELTDQRNPLVGRLLDLQKRKPSIVDEVQEECDEKPPGVATVKEVQRKRKEGNKDGFLVTTQHYFVGGHSGTPALSHKAEERNTKQSSVEVPSYREAKIGKIRLRRIGSTSSWQILSPSNESKNGHPCDEDTSDEAYKKLHDKLEREEKKMKRRDLERQRNEELKIKAKNRNQKKKGKKTRPKEPSLSLLPKPEEATHIQVEEYLPVTAFGLSVPDLSRSQFSLPWLKSTQPSLQSDV